MELFITQFFQDHPKFYERVTALEKKRSLNILGKLANEKNEVNFHSWRSEVGFGFFFDAICEDMKFEERIEGKEPDWTILMNGEKFLAEVLRLNTKEDELLETLQQEKKMMDSLKEQPTNPIIGRGKVKTMSSKYFYGHQSKLVKKEISYRDIIRKLHLPFIICIESTIDTFISDLDTFDFLIGNTKSGFFYTDANFGKTVTGVLLKDYFGQFVYYHNDLAENQFNDLNMKSLKGGQYASG